jgi:hypothetical protein
MRIIAAQVPSAADRPVKGALPLFAAAVSALGLAIGHAVRDGDAALKLLIPTSETDEDHRCPGPERGGQAGEGRIAPPPLGRQSRRGKLAGLALAMPLFAAAVSALGLAIGHAVRDGDAALITGRSLRLYWHPSG